MFASGKPTTLDEAANMLVPDGIFESNWNEVVKNFSDMNLKKELLRGICDFGFKRPLAIHQLAILPCINQRNVIVQAQPGTGKTATFSIAVLQRIDINVRECQALILVPTPELATQIQKEVIFLGNQLSAKCNACIGGTNVELESDSHIVVGTPAAVFSMINSRVLQTRAIKMLVLEETDEMLSFGFNSYIQDVFSELSKDVQTILLSSTMPTEVLAISTKFMRDPVKILVKEEELSLKDLTSSSLDIDIVLLFTEFGKKASEKKTIQKSQINALLIKVGLVVDQNYIDRCCNAIGVQDEMTSDDFYSFIYAYKETLRIVRAAKRRLTSSSPTSTISSITSTLTDPDEAEAVRKSEAKKIRLDSKTTAINVLLESVQKENECSSVIPACPILDEEQDTFSTSIIIHNFTISQFFVLE